jgi:phage shock protein B
LGVGTLTVLLVFAIPIVARVGGLAIAALNILKGSGGPRSQRQDAEETRMVQTIYNELSRMEERIEALETLLIERERKAGEQ